MPFRCPATLNVDALDEEAPMKTTLFAKPVYVRLSRKLDLSNGRLCIQNGDGKKFEVSNG
jgi:hypothetical protein